MKEAIEMNLKKICIVAEAYPDVNDPSFTFVQQLASSLSNIGWQCSIIAPQSLTKIAVGHARLKPKICEDSDHEKVIKVYRPYIFTFSNTQNTVLLKIADWFWSKAVRWALRKIGDVDVIYCYFWHVGLKTANSLLKKHIPLFVQASECEIGVFDYQKKPKVLDSIIGVICASGKNQNESISEGLTSLDKTCIAVNGYRKDEFYQMNKAEVRAKFGFPQDAFIVSFVGGFIKRKGIAQLNKALEKLEDVYSIFIGKGDIKPTKKNCLFANSVSHNNIVEYLNCSDAFVLPTEAEGCCNAIIEAVACGLPVISSNKSFNDEIIDESCSIRVNEQSEEEIYNAIKELKTNRSKCESLSRGALEKAKDLTIEHRAAIIDRFINQRLSFAENRK